MAEVEATSELAEAISEAIDSTTNHAALIDQVIAQFADIRCSYCGASTYKGSAVVDGYWSDEARKAMTDHILTCGKRPERELCDKLDASQKKIAALVEALRKVTLAFQAKCENWDEWCGLSSCSYCGDAARIIEEADALLAEEE